MPKDILIHTTVFTSSPILEEGMYKIIIEVADGRSKRLWGDNKGLQSKGAGLWVWNECIPVNFSMEHKSMLANVKMLMERDGDYVAINQKFDKLIMSLRTAVEKGEGVLDKEATSYDDVFDAFRLETRMYYFRSKDDDSRTHAYVYSIWYKQQL
jgi:hypothetical protein